VTFLTRLLSSAPLSLEWKRPQFPPSCELLPCQGGAGVGSRSLTVLPPGSRVARQTDEPTSNVRPLPARLCAQPGQPLSRRLSALRAVAAPRRSQERHSSAASMDADPHLRGPCRASQSPGYPASPLGLGPADGPSPARSGHARHAPPGAHRLRGSAA